jgi:hypothetical protein
VGEVEDRALNRGSRRHPDRVSICSQVSGLAHPHAEARRLVSAAVRHAHDKLRRQIGSHAPQPLGGLVPGGGFRTGIEQSRPDPAQVRERTGDVA